MSKLDEMLEDIDEAIENEESFTIEVLTPHLKSPEVITNPVCNLLAKRDYYKNAYTDELKHKGDSKVEIVNYYANK